MKRNRYKIRCSSIGHHTTIQCASISDAKSYISGNRDTLFKNSDTVEILRGNELYGSYILYNGKIIEVQKGDFRQ